MAAMALRLSVRCITALSNSRAWVYKGPVRLPLRRLAQAEEYGQPQEAATWDFLSLMYVHQAASEGSIAEACPFISRLQRQCYMM